MSRLALFLLGPPGVERDGVLVEVDTRKAIALLAYLAITRQQQSRDTLATLLWPEYDQPHARATLRRTLSALNKALAGNWLEIGRETVSLKQNSDFWLDVEHFLHLLAQCQTHGHSSSEICSACLQPLTEAVALYRDDFLVGFSLRDSPNFDSWQFYQADSLRRDLANALERLVQCYSSQSDYEPAISYARRWLALDRLHEPAHRELMRLYAWSGDRTAALHQYRECVQVLDQELGVAPLAETTRLYQAIKENQLPPPPSIQPPPSVGRKETTRDTVSLSGPPPALSPASLAQPLVSSAHVPLVGRSAEWEKLNEAYTGSSAHSSIIILSGEAGIGKTRLAEELVAYAQSRGASVVAARCYEGETELAYEPIVEGLRTMLAHKQDVHWLENVPEPWLSEASRLVP